MVQTSLTEKQKQLILRNRGLVKGYIFNAINKGKVPPYLQDEFISRMYWRFCISALKYEKEQGFKFSTYAYGGFDLACEEVLKREKKKYHRTNFKSHEDLKIFSEKEKPEVEVGCLYELLDKANLPEDEKQLLTDYYFNHLSLSGLSKKFGISRWGASIIIKRGVAKLQGLVTRRKLCMDDFYK